MKSYNDMDERPIPWAPPVAQRRYGFPSSIFEQKVDPMEKKRTFLRWRELFCTGTWRAGERGKRSGIVGRMEKLGRG